MSFNCFSAAHADILTLQIFGVRPPSVPFLSQQEKKRTLKRVLKIESVELGQIRPLSESLLAESRAKLEGLDQMDRDRVKLEASRNKVESYVYKIKNTLADKEEELKEISTEEQREECSKLAAEAQDWMEEEGYKAEFAVIEDKYADLSEPFEKIMLRLKEKTARPQAVKKLNKNLGEIEELMTKWEATKPQITEAERNGVLGKVEQVRKWLSDNLEKQEATQPHEPPVFLSTDIPIHMIPIETEIMRLEKRPKPKAPKKPKKDKNATATNSTGNETDASDGNATADSENDTSSSGEREESKTEEETETKGESSKEEASPGDNTESPTAAPTEDTPDL